MYIACRVEYRKNGTECDTYEKQNTYTSRF